MLCHASTRENAQPNHHNDTNRFSHPRQHTIQLSTHNRREFVREYHKQHANESNEHQLLNTQTFPTQSTKIHEPTRHPRQQTNTKKFSAHKKMDLQFTQPHRQNLPRIRHVVLPTQ